MKKRGKELELFFILSVIISIAVWIADAHAGRSPKPKNIGIFTAYTADPRETDASPFITADGTNLKETDFCIVANNDHPFGTKIRVEGFGECEIRDRMHRRYTGKNAFDIYFGTDRQAAIEFGRQKLGYRIMSSSNDLPK